MRYPQDVVDEVRAGNDIVDVVGGYVELKSRGGNFFGLCPFHRERTPSFSVAPDKQIYYCFGCGAGGNVISFVMQIENYGFFDALKFLADRVHYSLPEPVQSEAHRVRMETRDRLRVIHKSAARFYYGNLMADTVLAGKTRDYLAGRGIDSRLVKSFGLGLSSFEWDELYKNLQLDGFNLSDMVESALISVNKRGGHYDRFRGRLMFPILDVDGHVVGFGGRVMDDDDSGGNELGSAGNASTASAPKYLNSPETLLFDKSRQLYGIHAARKARSKEIIIVEGYMDVLSLHQAGYTSAVGVLGTALTLRHAQLIKRINADTVTILFDRDRAGVAATLRAIPILLEVGLKVKCLQVSDDAKDPDEYIQKYGAVRFGQLLQLAKNHAEFRIDLLSEEHDLTRTEGRIEFTQKAATVLATIENAIEADAYIRKTADQSGIAPQAIVAEMDKQRGRYLQGTPTRDRPGLRLNLRGQKNERGLIDARKGILSLLIAYPLLGGKMQDFLQPEEMGDTVMARLLEIAYQNAHQNEEKEPADIIALFENLEEQRLVAELLRESPQFSDNTALEKAINDMLRIVKSAWLEQKMTKLEQTDDEKYLNAVNSLGIEIRNLQKQYITITNG